MKTNKLMMAAVGAAISAAALNASAAVAWRWTSNATAADPVWTEVAEREVRLPAFTGASAADNVLELLAECTFAGTLPAQSAVTIRSASAAGSLVFAPATNAGAGAYALRGLSDDRRTALVEAARSGDSEAERMLAGELAGEAAPAGAFGWYLRGDTATAARLVNDQNAKLHGKVEDGWLVWTEGGEVVKLPTVDGQEVNPDAVFSLARSTKPIVYPSEPELTGEKGEQRIGFGGFSVVVPRHYTASVQGCVIVIELNENAAPTIADSEGGEKRGIDVAGDKVRIHFETRAAGLYYTLESTPELTGAWGAVAGPQTGTDFEVPISGDKSYYRIAVRDVVE